MSDGRRMKTVPAREAHDRCADCAIRHRAVCTYCSVEELSLLDAIKTYRTYEPGQEIVAAGETTDYLGSVVDGVVSLSKTMADGRRQMVGLMFPSDFVGRPMSPVAPYDATAVTRVRLCLFTRSRFERLLRETPALEKRLLEMTLDELDAARDWMLLLGRKTAREKISTFLTILARRSARADQSVMDTDFAFELPLTREAMADYLGLTIETVSRQLTALKKQGVVRMPDARTIAIPDFMALLSAAGDDADGGMID